MTRSQIKDMIWHGGKTLLCAIQFWILFLLVKADFSTFLEPNQEEFSLFGVLTYFFFPAVVVALFVALWRYYDTVDDRSFNKVREAAEPPHFLHDPAYLLGIALTALTVTPALTMALRPLFQYLRLGAWATAVALLTALAITVGGSALRVSNLNKTWIIQSKMYYPKPPSTPLRIFYAAVYFVALLLISKGLGVGIFVAFAVLIQFWIPLLAIMGAICLWCFAILPLLNIPARRKFMLRLQELQKQGKVSVEIHGHPYLSLFFEFVPFGLTVTVTPHPDAKEQKETTYKATFANCKRRREIVILCEGNVYQFVYSLKFSHVDRFSRMGADNARVRTVSLPGMTRFTNHTFDFPEGEGERILLIDRSPTVLAVRNVTGSDLFELDNASQVFGYTVYVKNAFINLLTRM